ncbi:MAG: prepilin peptidase [Gammaproteobacteria bacterium]|nr:prepilin peptidase [Gammaproteobacteria bacterium]
MLSSAVVLAVGCPAIWIDFRTQRIPNLLVVTTLLTACVVQLGLHGTAGIGLALGGAAVGLLLFPLYLAGTLGAGDVKFMVALGALVGPATALLAIALTLVAGGGLALATMGWRAWASFAAPSGNRLPYAAAIVVGTLAASLIAAD